MTILNIGKRFSQDEYKLSYKFNVEEEDAFATELRNFAETLERKFITRLHRNEDK